jgi:NSS family neurotransmitter:Na+ symporter
VNTGESNRETFATRLGLLATMIGVAVGLGNVWRFPYMVGRFGGAAFVLLYVVFALFIGVPALMAEWTLGRHTRRGSVGAFQRAGFPGGRWLGWVLFGGVTAATGYYCNAIGWVLFHGLAELANTITGILPGVGGPERGGFGGGTPLSGAAVLPPDTGFSLRAFLLQLIMTGGVVLGAALVLIRGVRKGIEGISRLFTPLLFFTLLLIIIRSNTLPGAEEGLRWFILSFRPHEIDAAVALAAMGQVVFSMALGGTFMVVYGSYLKEDERLGGNALFTVAGDTSAGLLAGLAIFPAVFALDLEPGGGPGLIFSTLPAVFAEVPGGSVFGLLFFLSLAGVAFLSAVAAFEVLVAGLTDNTSLRRREAILTMASVVLLVSLPPMVNMRIFLPWDLAFGSGLQTAGVLLAVLAVGWSMDRGMVMKEMLSDGDSRTHRSLYLWIRWVIPLAILSVGGWWFATEALPALASDDEGQEAVTLSWERQDSNLSSSLRGLSAVSDQVAWVSGSEGSFAFTRDGGESWVAGSVPGADSLDFRDVQAFPDGTAYLMSAGSGPFSRIYKSQDWGESWTLQHTNEIPEGFFNGFAFWDRDRGILVGDPVDGSLFILVTTDGGARWDRLPEGAAPSVVEGEYGFAASGTNIAVFGPEGVAIASGGSVARVFRSEDRGASWEAVQTPMSSGEPTKGAFSIAFGPMGEAVVVGGDYQNPELTDGTIARSSDAGLSWALAPGSDGVGFRSGVAYLPHPSHSLWVTVGTPGSSYSVDGGRTWAGFDTTPFNAVAFATVTGWAAGPEGGVARLSVR